MSFLELREKNEYSRSYLTEELDETRQAEYDRYVQDIRSRLTLSRKQTEQMIADFNAALICYVNKGMTLSEAMHRLDPENLGHFYMQKSSNFYPLDNAAVIYPLGMRFGSMPMFRVSAYLNEMVIPEILQMALTFTIRRFPSFATAIKAGFFWHYLDSTNMRYSIEEERVIPCIPINVAGLTAQSFRVLYYKKRISVELFHVLTDGSGAMIFLKTLTAEYLRLLGHDISCENGVWDIKEEPAEAETVNEFAHAEIREGVEGFMGKRAVQINGRITGKPCRVLHLEMNAEKLHEVAKGYGVTVTAYMAGQMMIAIRKATEGKKGEVRVQVPVNMRKFNNSTTIRNYSMYFGCELNRDDITELKDILPSVQQQILEKSTADEMGKMMSTTVKLVGSLKLVPLLIKKPVARIVYGFLGDQIFTTFLSNLGVVKAPDEMKKYVDHLDFVLGPSDLCRASCGLISFNGRTVFNITKITSDPAFEEAMYQQLTADGLEVEVTGSGLYED